jgi:serine/threonine protein kinase
MFFYLHRYLAPEVIMSRGHDGSADHWSLGVLIYEMLMGENPFYFEGMNQVLLFQSIAQDVHEPPVGVSEEAVDIINGFLTKDPAMRLGSLARRESDILQHAWFHPLDLQAMRRRQPVAPWIPPLKGQLDATYFDDWSDTVDKTELSFPKISEKHAKEFEEF